MAHALKFASRQATLHTFEMFNMLASLWMSFDDMRIVQHQGSMLLPCAVHCNRAACLRTCALHQHIHITGTCS